jgi:hypothetical protein
LDIIVGDLFPNEVKVHLNMFSTCMEHRLEAKARAPELSHHKVGGDKRGRWSSLSSMRIQYISVIVRHMERYSASILERDTTFCFLADQEIRLEPRKMPYPVVEHLSSGLLAQSASQYALKVSGLLQ